MHDLVIRAGDRSSTGRGRRRARPIVAIDDGVITEVGDASGRGAREIDADGALVTPGWVDIHTHYDGQVTWDAELAPVRQHGVTTVVMGNCGVGFAPVRARRPGLPDRADGGRRGHPRHGARTRASTGSGRRFAEYLDALERRRARVDVGGPGAARRGPRLRAWASGPTTTTPTADEIAEMVELAQAAIAAGAVGFSTSRTILHTSKHGLVPGTTRRPTS